MRLHGAARLLVLFAISLLVAGSYAPCDFPELEDQLANATLPVTYGEVIVAIPIQTLWAFFSQPQYWPLWNIQFNATFFTELSLCGQVKAIYTTFPNLPLPPISFTTPIVQYDVTDTNITLGYAYQVNDSTSDTVILFGRHTFNFVSVSVNSTLFSSWETSIGMVADKFRPQWHHANRMAMLEAIVGVECLEEVYLNNGSIAPEVVGALCPTYWPAQLKCMS